MTQTAITKPTPDLSILAQRMTQAGTAANQAASRRAFADHTARKASNTIRRKRADLALFETFLNAHEIPAAGLFDNPQAWQGVTWGIVKAFADWQILQGYAIASINGRLSTVRTYAKLAAKAGAISAEESIMIASVEGYANKERKHIDSKRKAEGLPTRKGHKKAEAVTIAQDQAEAMKAQPSTPQGRRDALLMCLFLDHGLRVGEVAILTAQAFDMKAGTFTFYRPKVQKTQTHTMSRATREAARAYLRHDAPADGILWRKSNKGTGKLSGQMSVISAERAITKRVELLGRKVGLTGLSAHDTRHYWATNEARNNTAVDRLMDAGGWNSPAMPMRYIERAHIANAGTVHTKGKD